MKKQLEETPVLRLLWILLLGASVAVTALGMDYKIGRVLMTERADGEG